MTPHKKSERITKLKGQQQKNINFLKTIRGKQNLN